MPLATPVTVVSYLHKTYGLRSSKVQELLQEPTLAAILQQGTSGRSFDYYVAEQIMDALTEGRVPGQQLPEENSDEYDVWVDPAWTPSEEALLDAEQDDENLEDDDLELDDDDPEEDDDSDLEEDSDLDEVELEEEEDEDEYSDLDDDEDEEDSDLDDDDENDDEHEEQVTGQFPVSTGNLIAGPSTFDALRAAHLGFDSRLPQ
jgi:hypothetical protein